VLLQDLAAWNVLCSALDVIGDTHMAITSYEAMQEVDDDGARYLVIYGILQVLFVQQDAVEHILESLGIEVPDADPDLAHVREIRNRATGHPTKRERRTKQHLTQRSHFISRFTLRTTGFQLMTTHEDRQTEFIDVEIPDLIGRQRAGVARMLTSAVQKLREREVEHRNKFKDKKLADIFPDTVRYYVGKVSVACHGDYTHKVLASDMVDLLTDIVTNFKNALVERGILPAYESLRKEIDDVEYTLGELKRYFADSGGSTLNCRSSYVFSFFIEQKLQDLKKAAEEFDDDYASPVPE
jgi:hypothetical protein